MPDVKSDSAKSKSKERDTDDSRSSTAAGACGGVAAANDGETCSTEGSPSSDKSDSDKSGSLPQESLFECNICLDTARDAVVSRCGHLFCWPCLYQWFETRPYKQTCPVCKAGISKESVTPLYGRGSTKQQDPREKIPQRPPGERPEPETQGPFQGFGFGEGGFQMSFGIGAFPFGFFASAFNIGDGGRFMGHPHQPPAPPNADEQFLSKVFLWVAVLFVVWLLIA